MRNGPTLVQVIVWTGVCLLVVAVVMLLVLGFASIQFFAAS